ncbi:hypothetical protein ABEP42_13825 [Priestia megaterium]|uniref:hypothetical protein n=1 Tax=Priestia megaterium TaxID=1404 RepID=UPI00317A5676
MIETARSFLLNEVDDPALNHPELSQEIKNKVQSSKNVVRNLKKIGDLYRYLKRFNHIPSPGGSAVYDKMKALTLLTMEVFSTL